MKRLWLRICCWFTKHDWDCVAGFEILGPPRVPWFKCKRCGKEEGLKR